MTPPHPDYLALTLLHGFRQLDETDVIDYPRYAAAYDDFPLCDRERAYGRGFSVFFLLKEAPVDRSRIEDRLAGSEFDLIVFGCIWVQFELFARWRKWLRQCRTAILDGEDTSQVYPAAGKWWRNPRYWFVPRAHRNFLYFKREWTPDSHFNLWHRFLPAPLRSRLRPAANLRRIAFSFPSEKIVEAIPGKTKDFPLHIVDSEIAACVPGSSTDYAFDSEAAYYADLRASRFGITTRRAGWDCLRHYEIAANGCVPCFRDLDKKPATCAPHGLEPGANCIAYCSAEDLFKKLGEVSPREYLRLARGALKWARQNATVNRAQQLLDEIRSFDLTSQGEESRA